MTKIEANVPDYLAPQALAAAERDHDPIDQIVALALSAQIAAWQGSDAMETRARRANLETFDRFRAKGPMSHPCPVTNYPLATGAVENWCGRY